jgi:hypothetical protein
MLVNDQVVPVISNLPFGYRIRAPASTSAAGNAMVAASVAAVPFSLYVYLLKFGNSDHFSSAYAVDYGVA